MDGFVASCVMFDGESAALNHEARDDPVEDRAVIERFVDIDKDVLDGKRSLSRYSSISMVPMFVFMTTTGFFLSASVWAWDENTQAETTNTDVKENRKNREVSHHDASFRCACIVTESYL
jgi:hypothetical protein